MVMVMWNSHLSYFTSSFFWVFIKMYIHSFVFNFRYQPWILMDMYGIAKAITTMTLLLKEQILSLKSFFLNSQLLVDSRQPPLIWNMFIVWNRESPSNYQRSIFKCHFIGEVVDNWRKHNINFMNMCMLCL